jgi:hypothetical protein
MSSRRIDDMKFRPSVICAAGSFQAYFGRVNHRARDVTRPTGTLDVLLATEHRKGRINVLEDEDPSPRSMKRNSTSQ